MRVVEPHHFKSKKRHRPNLVKPLLGLFAVAVVISGGLFFEKIHKNQVDNARPAVQLPIQPTQTAPKTVLKTFTGNQFKDLYRSVMQSYPNTQTFPELPIITGNIDADNKIRALAEARGFKLTRIPVTALVKTNEPRLAGEADDLLQPLAFQGWQKLKEAAVKDKIPLALNSAYRSPDWQRQLFTQRLYATGATDSSIAAGYSDSLVNQTLNVTAVPGYSRHHTGYTVDFWCEDGTGNFTNSSCFKWLEADNYKLPKEAGFIPSYPPGADEQGPEPESWEYVWVGTDALYQ